MRYLISSLLFLFYILYPFQDISLFTKFLKPYYLVFLCLFFLTLIYILYEKKIFFSLLKFYLVYFLFLDFTFISLIWSVKYSDSIYATTKYIVYFLISFTLSYLIAKNLDLIKKIAQAIYLSAFMIASIYIYTFIKVGGLSILEKKASMSTIAKVAAINVGFGGGRNLLASWLVFSLSFALPILIYSSKKNKKLQLLYFISVLIITIPIFLTLSRTAILALIFFLISTFFLKEFFFLKRILQYTFFIIVLILTLNIFNLRSFFIERFKLIFDTFSGTNIDYGTLGRLELWNYAYKSFKENPFLGTGIGTLYKGLSEIGGVHNYHNIFIQFSAQLGFLGLLLFLLWTFWLIFIAIKNLKYSRNSYLKYISLLILINIIIYYIKALFMFQYFDLEIWTLISLTGGLYAKRQIQKRYLYFNSSL